MFQDSSLSLEERNDVLDPKTSNLNPKTMKDFPKIFMLQAIFARFLKSADKFYRIFPCKKSEFSMFYKTNLATCMHAFCMFYLHVSLGYSMNNSVPCFRVAISHAYVFCCFCGGRLATEFKLQNC